MQYNKQADGSYKEMERRCVDTGMGIERTSAILQGKQSVYETESFVPLIKEVEKVATVAYGDSEEGDMSVRIITDHVKTSTMILGDEQVV